MRFEELRPGMDGSVAVFEGGNGKEVLQAEVDEVRARIKREGVVLFKGFGLSVNEYEDFTDQLGKTQEGVPGDGADQLSGRREVYVGRGALSAHAEDTYVPWPPDLLWLYCVHPASDGGRTVVWDGIQFLSLLDDRTRRLFEQKRLKFTQFFTSHAWTKRFGPTAEAVLEAYGDSGIEFSFLRGNALKTTYVTSAIRKTRWQGQPAFCNTILHALDDPDFYGLSFEDGSPIEKDLEMYLRRVAKSARVPLEWQEQAFVVVDNTRWMHGREAYTDPGRRILARHQMALF